MLLSPKLLHWLCCIFDEYDKLLMPLSYALRAKVLLSDERSEEFRTFELCP